tara:strand:+ start:2172 stop:3104 length:933 start_codon:yes stop_codon:yes gene_type:complete
MAKEESKIEQYLNGEISYSELSVKVKKQLCFNSIYEKYMQLEIKPKVAAVVKDKRKSKYNYYKIKLDHFMQHCGSLKIRGFDYEAASEYKLLLSEEVVQHTGRLRTQKTVHNYLAEVKQLVSWCIKMKYASYNPLKEKGFMPSTEATAPRKALPLAWVEDAIQNAERYEDKVYWTILLHTGCRANDGGNLTPEDIELGIFQEKTKKYRKLMITPTILEFGDIIYGICPTKHLQRKSRERFQKYIADKHDGYHTVLHEIRHTTFTYLVNNGFDRSQVGEILGTISSVGTYAETDFNRAVDVISSNFTRFTA